jgi:alkylhydroperoxidase/carboxymuconolactone decarboxylase family protein YurZ
MADVFRTGHGRCGRNERSFPVLDAFSSQEVHMPKLPMQYRGIWKKYASLMKAVESLGKAAKEAGPVSLKNSHLIQLAAAAAIQSEGSVHSHTRRALEAGAKPDEVRHAVILLTSTIGFPRVSAALSWVEDVLGKKKK